MTYQQGKEGCYGRFSCRWLKICPFLIIMMMMIPSGLGLSSSGNSKRMKIMPTTPSTTSVMTTNTCNRRTAIQSTIGSAMAVFLMGVAPPSHAAYIDSNTSDATKITKRVYLDVQLPKEEKPQRIIIGLFGDAMPKTTENFIKLCSGDNGYSYAGSTFYRVLSGMTIQGGAIGDVSGKTGKSAIDTNGNNGFEPDNFNILHNRAGLVSMVRGIGGSVDSRFFINTVDDSGWADDRYAAFGIVEEGMDFVRKIEKVDVKPPQNRPKETVQIVASGILSD